MKKLFHLLFLTIIFHSHVFGIVIGPSKELKPIIIFFPSNDPEKPEEDTFPYDMKKKILLEFAQNVHRYSTSGYDRTARFQLCSNRASQIIFNVSLVNKDLYKKLDKQRNDPITARSIITKITSKLNFNVNLNVINGFTFPGAKKCRELSEQLYKNDLTKDEVENLFKQGAIINFSVTAASNNPDLKEWPLHHWYQLTNRNQDIIKKLLDLGADPVHSTCNFLEAIILNADSNMTKMILNYKPKISHDVWLMAISINTDSCINLLIPYATQDELDFGLANCVSPTKFKNCCISYMQHKQIETMQQFIDHGANPNVALDHLMTEFATVQNAFDHHKEFKKIFKFLCKQKAFD
jgi:hypothetical protein